MEKKKPTEAPIVAESSNTAALEKKVKMLSISTGVLFVFCAFLGYKAFMGGGVSKAQLEAAKAERQNTTVPGQTTTANGQNPIKPTNSMVPEVDPATATTMAFEENVFDFGKITEGEKVSHVFKFKNTGNKPLIISNAQGSCGCTVPQYAKEPIAPGAESEMKVEFDSKGKVGSQSKTVTITANTIPAQTILTIKSEVVKLEGK